MSAMLTGKSERYATHTISITSGKGGVGKTTIVANVALSLAQKGNRVLILDGDLGMGNVDIMFGVKHQYSINDLLRGDVEISELILEVAPNVFLLPGGSGVLEVQNLSDAEKRILLDQVSEIPMSFDYMLVDTAPGIADNVLYLNTAANEICVVVTPDPASVADSYALIKVLNKYYKQDRFSIICNQTKDEAEGLALFRRLSDVASRFLFVSLNYRGFIPDDPILSRATRSQQLCVSAHPGAASSLALKKIGQNLSVIDRMEHPKGGIQFFWTQFLGVA